MYKKITALLACAAVTLSAASGCSKKNETSAKPHVSNDEMSFDEDWNIPDKTDALSSEDQTENPAEAVTEHVSPTVTVTSRLGAQTTPDVTLGRSDGSNTVKLPLSDFIQDGDIIESFTFIIYSDDGKNIGTFKGGCGISVTKDCPSGKDGWYQCPDFTAPTQGTYGEITWTVPAELREYISSGGDIMFGYWWGNASSIRLDTAVCTYTRTANIPCDGSTSVNVGKSVSYSDADNKVGFAVSEAVPDGNIPTSVTFDISSQGSLGKFTGAFSVGSYQSQDIAVFTDSPNVTLTWILPEEAKAEAARSEQIELGYWWSEQNSITLNSATVNYAYGKASPAAETPSAQLPTADSNDTPTSDLRSAKELVNAINVGWCLGNTLDCYDYSSWTTDAETAWGNVRTTKAMIDSVKAKGFNSIRIPVTWGEHMNGNTIDTAWMKRVKEVVDYAYGNGMIVILNMHHDDYTWFVPNESQYAANSAKLCAIWTQISAEFKDYGDRLLFEGMNEPRTVGTSAEWNGGTAPERAVINKYEQDFVNTVRASGGNNSDRTLIVTTYAASAVDSAINDVVIPNDKNIILSLHYYAPWKFSVGESTAFGASEKAELDTKFSQLKSKFVDKGINVIIGEFGCVKAASDDVRAQYYEYYIKSAKANGLKCFIWDNGVLNGDDTYGLFDREKLTWNDTIINAVMNASK